MQKIKCRRTGQVFEKQFGAAAELLHMHVVINHHRGRRIGAQHDSIGHFQKIAAEICAGEGCRSCPIMREFKATWAAAVLSPGSYTLRAVVDYGGAALVAGEIAFTARKP